MDAAFSALTAAFSKRSKIAEGGDVGRALAVVRRRAVREGRW